MKLCAFCEKPISRELFKNSHVYKRAKFCSRDCYSASRAPLIEIVQCPACDKKFDRIATRAQKKLFCSIACQYNARLVDGHRYITTQGYVAIKKHGHPLAYSDGYVLEHRLVMSEKLGRTIKSDEHIHHIDGNKTNNHPDNLELISNDEHQILHYNHERINSSESIAKRINTRWGRV